MRYRTQTRFADTDQMSADPIITDRALRFVALCGEKARTQRGYLAFPGGLVTGEASVRAAARRGDPWATGALRFAQMADQSSLPF